MYQQADKLRLPEDFQSLLRIDKNRLDDHLEEQADLFYIVAQRLAASGSRQDFLSKSRTQTQNRIADALRADCQRQGVKIVETRIAAEAQTSPEYKEAQQAYWEEKSLSAEWGALRDAFQQRSFMLRELANLYSAGYWTDVSTHDNSAQEVASRRDRQRLDEGRKKRPTRTRVRSSEDETNE